MLRLATFLSLALLAGSSVRAADGKEAPKKKPPVIAHLKLSGNMAEQAPSTDPLGSSLVEAFKAKIDRLKKVAADKEVAAVLLEVNGVSAGFGKLNEITVAIARIRAAGKKVHAFIEGGEMKDWLIGLACDEVAIPESSWLMLTGLRSEITFYKGLFDKLGIKADFVMMGDFKSAAEPYLRDSLSEANRKQMTEMIDDFFENDLVGRIVKGRKGMDAAKVKEIIDGGPYSARAAKKLGLVDRLCYYEDMEGIIKEALKADDAKLVKDYGKKKEEELTIASLYSKLLFGGGSGKSSSKNPKVAVIYATGMIVTGKGASSPFMGDAMGSDTMVKAIREAIDDKTVKAIVLRIDSPGGSALASDLMWKELKRAKKPIIASMADVAASGGYYIAMAADRIYAEPGTVTGSIGVLGGKLTMRGLYDKLGIKTEVIKRGENAGLLSGDLFTDSQKKAFREMMEDTYAQFIDKALEGRKKAGKDMTREQLVKLAGGRVWTGRQAKQNGLIDELGTLEDAIAAAAKLGGLPPEPELIQMPKPKNFLDSLLGGGLGVNVDLKTVTPELAQKLAGVAPLWELRREPVWALVPWSISVK
ncbi:MAG: signal peptide peptidase SppA [Gemmataceae bacterium]|nr:signal peptide peptidase SppA [Gemmataceae bacterium]